MPGETVRGVLAKHAHTLVSLPGVVGVAEGEADGRPCITVYVDEQTPSLVRQIPTDLEGWPVVVRESGEFRAVDDDQSIAAPDRRKGGTMGRVVHFEYATPDPEKEVAFFKALFGWDIQRWGDEEYWLADTGKDAAGINGAIMPLRTPDQPRVVNTVAVDDLDASLAKATAAGATIAMEKQEVPNVGWVAYVVSPTGIVLGMLQPMPGSTAG